MSVEVFLSTLSLRRATNNFFNCRFNIIISIHALLAESDQQPNNQEHPSSLFLSTLSLRRATKLQDCRNSQNIISIHALLAESDPTREANRASQGAYFYPRSPCGERHRRPIFFGQAEKYFYPRSPCGERPKIHQWPAESHYFYPRSPCGERPVVVGPSSGINCISIHALLAESDASSQKARQGQHISIHALLAESDSPKYFFT